MTLDELHKQKQRIQEEMHFWRHKSWLRGRKATGTDKKYIESKLNELQDRLESVNAQYNRQLVEERCLDA